MTDFEALLNRFRALGGIADNIKLGVGVYGRGIFPVDERAPISIGVPEHMLVPVEHVVLDREGQVSVSNHAALDPALKDFYEDLQRDFGWGAGGLQHVREEQEVFLALPAGIHDQLRKLGMDAFSFRTPTPEWCLEKFKAARRFSRGSGYYMAPVLDMVNHDSAAASWSLDPLGISGIYAGEVLVNYAALLDPFSMYDCYGFSAETGVVNSVSLSLGHPSFGKISIGRVLAEKTAMSGAWVPKVSRLNKSIDFSYVPLINVSQPHLPREFFCQTMLVAGMDFRSAEGLFSSIVGANRKVFRQLQESLVGEDGPVADGLRTMVRHQLAALG